MLLIRANSGYWLMSQGTTMREIISLSGAKVVVSPRSVHFIRNYFRTFCFIIMSIWLSEMSSWRAPRIDYWPSPAPPRALRLPISLSLRDSMYVPFVIVCWLCADYWQTLLCAFRLLLILLLARESTAVETETVADGITAAEGLLVVVIDATHLVMMKRATNAMRANICVVTV